MAARRTKKKRAGTPRRPSAKRREQWQRVRTELAKLYPEVECALDHVDAFQLLVATILSAQCTDKTVNKVTPALFARYPDAQALARARQATLEKLIRPTGFFRNKAKNLIGMAQMLDSEFGGVVPRTIDELLRLPGVARKTANVVLGTAFGIASGVVVDTHVGRLSRRLGLTKQTDPVKVESDLMGVADPDDWIWLAHALIWHGRLVCDAKKPKCDECTMAGFCPSARDLSAVAAGR